MRNENIHASAFKMILTDLLMGFLFLLLLGFSLWLLWITFFREYFDTGIIENSRISTIDQLTIVGMNKQDHFHNLDESILKISKSPSVCMKCHGSYPHSKSKHVRAFLNAHSYFMACEVCHLKEKKRSQVSFKWLDDKTGRSLEFFPTKFKAKIVPITTINGSVKRLDESSDKDFVEKYIQLRDTFDADQEAAAKLRIHRNVSDNAVLCDDCHTIDKTPFLPYHTLNYTKERISEIAGSEVVGMVKKYKRFYLPNFLQRGPF